MTPKGPRRRCFGPQPPRAVVAVNQQVDILLLCSGSRRKATLARGNMRIANDALAEPNISNFMQVEIVF